MARDADINQRAFIYDARAFGKKEKSIKAALQASLAAILPDADEQSSRPCVATCRRSTGFPFIHLLNAASSSLRAKIPTDDFRNHLHEERSRSPRHIRQ